MNAESSGADRARRLGRGLGALIGQASPPTAGGDVPAGESLLELPLREIQPNPMQPRRDFGQDELSELKASLEANGLLQPITVRRRGGHFELVAGERRVRAARSLGWPTIPAVIKDVPDEKLLLFALVENLQRENLNAIDEAEGYRRLGSDFGLTQQQIAEAVGKDRSTISNSLRLLALPADVQQLLRTGTISNGHARALLGLPNDPAISRAARVIVERQLNVRQTESLATEGRSRSTRRPRSTRASDAPEVRQIRDRLRRALQTDVNMVADDGGRGEIRIRFYSAEDLDRLLEIIAGPVPDR